MAEAGGRPQGTAVGVGAMLTSVVIIQTGASFGKRLIDEVPGPMAAVWLRLGTAGVCMLVFWGVRALVLALRRRRECDKQAPSGSKTAILGPESGQQHPVCPALPARPRHALAVTAVFCVVMLTMNATIYEAFDRLPVGIAITLEFLGPLGVAIAGSVRNGRRLPIGTRGASLAGDLALIACAGAGVALLGVRPVALNAVGVVFALVAALCWAGYITLGGYVSRWYSSPRVLTVAWLVALLGFAIPALEPHGAGFLTARVLGLAVVVALSSSAVPTVLELFALGRVPPALFAILESLAPAVAALAAWPLLGEWLHPTDWLAIGLVV
ncbi:MAG: EamA family transporter, partial [Propionibacteriaceae bacterium]|nr:EamA family transporter [Propionibacteriaceae bacterium]